MAYTYMFSWIASEEIVVSVQTRLAKMISWAETSVTTMDSRVWPVRSINIRGESIHRQETGGLRSAARISGIDYREEKLNRKFYPGTTGIMLKSKRPERKGMVNTECW